MGAEKKIKIEKRGMMVERVKGGGEGDRVIEREQRENLENRERKCNIFLFKEKKYKNHRTKKTRAL